MVLTDRSKRRIKTFYRDTEGLSVPIKLVFDAEYSPSEKMCLTLICQLCWSHAAIHTNQFETDFNNSEMDAILGGVSLRSLHRFMKKFRKNGLIDVEILQEPRPNYRKIYLTSKGIKYFFDLDIGESVTTRKRDKALYW